MATATIVFQVQNAAAAILEGRIRAAVSLAGVTEDDIKSGRAKGETRTNIDCECHGSGIRIENKALSISVTLCPCFEVIVTRVEPMGGDAWTHV